MEMIVMHYNNIPEIRDLYDPIMNFMQHVEEAHTEKIRDAVANYFYMDTTDRVFKSDDNRKYSVFQKRINDACYNLCEAGLLYRIRRGNYRITTKGESAIEKDYFFDLDYIKQSKEDYIEKNSDDVIPSRPKSFHEFYEIKELTQEIILQLKEHDVRFSNMMRQEYMLLSDGKLYMTEKSISRIECSSEKEYISKVEEIKSSSIELSIYQDAKSKNKKIATRSPRLPGDNSKSKKPWTAKHEYMSNPDKYKEIVDKVKNSDTFGAALKVIVSQYEKISQAELSKQTGIPLSTIESYFSEKTKPSGYRNIYAIAIVLDIQPWLLEILMIKLDKRMDSETKEGSVYRSIYDIHVGMTIKAMNEYCQRKGVEKLFDVIDVP